MAAARVSLPSNRSLSRGAMPRLASNSSLSRVFADYGILGVLLLLCLCCSLGTFQQRKPKGRQAALAVAGEITAWADRQAGVVILAEDAQFADVLEGLLIEDGVEVVEKITGRPVAMRRALERLAADSVRIDGARIDAIATTMTAPVLPRLARSPLRA